MEDRIKFLKYMQTHKPLFVFCFSGSPVVTMATGILLLLVVFTSIIYSSVLTVISRSFAFRCPPSPSWELTWATGQMRHGVCVQPEIFPGHHGSAHWQLVHSCVCLCVCVFFAFASSQLKRLCREKTASPKMWSHNLLFKTHRKKKSFVLVCSLLVKLGVLGQWKHAALSHQFNHFNWLHDPPGRHLASSARCLCMYAMIWLWPQMHLMQ